MTPQRIQLRRTKGWRKPEGAVVVSRPSKWGNPFPVGKDSPFSPEDAVRMYREMIQGGEAWWFSLAGTPFETGHRFTRWHGDRTRPAIEEIRAELAGRDLACWCPIGTACHADFLLDLVNGDAA